MPKANRSGYPVAVPNTERRKGEGGWEKKDFASALARVGRLVRLSFALGRRRDEKG